MEFRKGSWQLRRVKGRGESLRLEVRLGGLCGAGLCRRDPCEAAVEKVVVGTSYSGQENSRTLVVVVMGNHAGDWSCCYRASVPHGVPGVLPLIMER